MAKAVVSTSIGAEGLPVTTGRDLEIADEPARFAQAVVRLMRDGVTRAQMQAAARRLVVDRYDWSAVAHDFEAALQRLAEIQRASPAEANRMTDKERAIA